MKLPLPCPTKTWTLLPPKFPFSVTMSGMPSPVTSVTTQLIAKIPTKKLSQIRNVITVPKHHCHLPRPVLTDDQVRNPVPIHINRRQRPGTRPRTHVGDGLVVDKVRRLQRIPIRVPDAPIIHQVQPERPRA